MTTYSFASGHLENFPLVLLPEAKFIGLVSNSLKPKDSSSKFAKKLRDNFGTDQGNLRGNYGTGLEII